VSALAFERVSVRLGGRAALDAVSLEIASGALVAVVGPNGAGKSTLLRVASGLLRAEGAVRLGGRDLRTLSAQERAAALAYLPQERRPAWGLPAVSVAALGAVGAAPDEAVRRGRRALARVGLSDLEDRGVFDMSGGERARVLLARVLASVAPVLLLDEPLAGLDPDARLQAMALFREEASRGAVVLVTVHDLATAANCDRVLVLSAGRRVADGPPREALRPEVLRSVFRLDGAWIEGPYGPLLAARRTR
jgi:iron complex transport system ATP-binding protein